MRIHFQKIIRSSVPYQSDYHSYLESLRSDFHCTCGYCGKTEQVTKRGFEIDHFVPQRLDDSRVNDYSNLVYSCYNCNRKKSGKFPTEDKTKCHNGVIGVLDPASDEFDENLERIEDGNIVGKTPLGVFICDKIFEFSRRPMHEIWLAMQIIERKKKIHDKISLQKIGEQEMQDYIDIDIKLGKLLDEFFNKGE